MAGPFWGQPSFILLCPSAVEFRVLDERSSVAGVEIEMQLVERTLWLGLAYLLVIGSVVALGSPLPWHEPGGVMVMSGHGFALKDSEYHIIRLSVVSLPPMEPVSVRRLLASNKSLEEIREEMRMNEGDPAYRGNMRLDDSIYLFSGIVVAPGEDNLTIRADIVDPGLPFVPGDESIVGHIAVTVSQSEGKRTGNGMLAMNRGTYRDDYTVVLEMQPANENRGDREVGFVMPLDPPPPQADLPIRP